MGPSRGFSQAAGHEGNRRFDDLVQSSRKNHFTIVESWDAPADKSTWIATPVARTFRQELQSISGGLYDERPTDKAPQADSQSL